MRHYRQDRGDYRQDRVNIVLVREDFSPWHDMQLALELAGFSVLLAGSRQELDRMVTTDARAILVFDLEACGSRWLPTIRKLAINHHLRIILLTADRGARQRLEALTAGVDVYLAKPVGLDEVKAVLRRVSAHLPEVPPALGLDKGRQLLLVSDGRLIKLTTLECWFLACLAEAPHRRATRQEVERFLWNGELSLTDKRLDVLVHRLRRKLETEAPELGNVVATHRSHGFSLLREVRLCELSPSKFIQPRLLMMEEGAEKDLSTEIRCDEAASAKLQAASGGKRCARDKVIVRQ